MSEAKPPKSVLFTQVGGGKEKEPLFKIRLSDDIMEQETLKELQTLIRDNGQTKEYSKLPFATADGAVVDNTWKIKDYLEEVKLHEPEKKDDSDKTPEVLKAYLKRSSEWKVEDSDIPKPKFELPDIPDHLPPENRDKLKSGIVKADWKAKAPTTNPQELGEKDWRLVTINNALCYGLSVLHQEIGNGKTTPVGLIRAPYPAFRLKSRRLFDAADESEPTVRVPDFIVDDQSYVSIYETMTDFQSSLSKSAINTADISASAGFPAFGGVLGVGGGVKFSHTSRERTDMSRQSSLMNISYHFPRVTLRLDEYSLELTDHCYQELKKAGAAGNADTFVEKFGEYFSTQIQLGGRLLASEEFDSKSKTSASDVKWALKTQATASFKVAPGGPGGSTSVGYGHGEGKNESKTNSQLDKTLQWQANGGNTLLCNNPPEWCPTVGLHHNWRIINRAGNRHILNVIARLEKPEGLKNEVKKLTTAEFRDPELPHNAQPVPPKRQGRMFYLRRSPKGDWSYEKYITAYQKDATEWTKKHIIDLRKTAENIPEESGTAMMHSELEDCHQYGCYLEFQSKQQGHLNGVTKIMYDQPYVLKNPSTELYFAMKNKDNGEYMLVATPELPEDGYWFIRGRDGTDAGPVAQNDQVTLRWGKYGKSSEDGSQEDTSPLILNIFYETHWSGLLKGAKKSGKVEELNLTLMYKDVYEGKAQA